MARFALLPLVLPLVVTGCDRPDVFDREAIAARYSWRVSQCNAWITSAVTGYTYCSSPAVPPAAVESAAVKVSVPTLKDGPTDVDSLRAHGEKVYAGTCAACHQADGKGMAGTFPPIAGNAGFYGDAQAHAKIVVHGLTGKITVAGVEFNGSMPPQGAALTDYDIAAVTTYERTSWGNADGVVLPGDVAAVR
jgi:mono/diheme cytochrome c family protein